MWNAIQELIDAARAATAWIPATVFGVVALVLAAALALTLHNWVSRLLRRLVPARSTFATSLLASARRVTRYALIVIALALLLPIVPLSSEATAITGKLLLLASIGLIGWVALIAIKLAADLYLLRFRIDVEDNLLARKLTTQVRVLERATETLVVLLTAGFALMTFESVRQYGVSLFASAGVAGIVAGLAARPLLSSLIAGVQIAVTQPIRLGDAVVVEGEWGWVEEITATYVVIKLWDWRRLVLPLSYFIEKPFQNWTRENAAIIGSVMLYLDYAVPVAKLRAKLEEIAKASKLWDGRVVNLQVTDAKEHTIEVRALVSAANSPAAWDLRCEVREKLIGFLQREHPGALPRQRADVALHDGADHAVDATRARKETRVPEPMAAKDASRH